MAEIEGVKQIDYIEYEKYGPGKFNSNVEEYFHNMSMDGTDDEIDVGEGWFGLLLFEKDPVVVDDEIIQAAIVHESTQGFADVQTFDDVETATDEWLKLEEEFASELKER